MKKLITIVALVALMLPGSLKAQDEVKIGKQNIKLTSNLMTPEALWAMGRIRQTDCLSGGLL